MNPNPGAPPIPNAVNVSLAAADGKFNVYNRFGNVAVVIDVMSVYDDHNHDDRYYTKTQAGTQAGGRDYTQTEADDTFVRQGGNIIMRHGTSEMTAVSGPSAPSTLENAGTGTVVSGDGAVTISPTGPFEVAGLEYGLQSIEYCIADVAGAQIDAVTVHSGTPNATLKYNTDRAAAGCHVVTANLDGAQAYDVPFVVQGGAANVGPSDHPGTCPVGTLNPIRGT